jgi:hypothetical protein
LFALLFASCGDDEPHAIETRAKLTACGSLPDRRMDAPASEAELRALECLRSAAQTGGTAEVSYAFLTTEGDPIRYWLRVLDDGSVEMYEHSMDSFGPSGWRYFATCDIAVSDLVSMPPPGGCGDGFEL